MGTIITVVSIIILCGMLLFGDWDNIKNFRL